MSVSCIFYEFFADESLVFCEKSAVASYWCVYITNMNREPQTWCGLRSVVGARSFPLCGGVAVCLQSKQTDGVVSAPKDNEDCEAVVVIFKTRSVVGARSVCSAPKDNGDCEAVFVIFKMRSVVGARSVCSAPKVNKDYEAVVLIFKTRSCRGGNLPVPYGAIEGLGRAGGKGKDKNGNGEKENDPSERSRRSAVQ